MSVLPVGFGGASGSYSITNSIRLNGTSDYLSRTLTTSATTSGSVWVKRSKLGAVSPIFDNKVYFTSGDALYAFGLTSTALYRDPSAWLHIFWNGTGVYVNGTLVTGSGTYTAASVTNPRLGYDGTNYFSGYLSNFAFWNGTSASLQGGATDANGVWAAKRPSAGYSFLAFGTSGALGTDTSGNGNSWSVSGSPVQTADTPTCNYCTLLSNLIIANVGSISNGSLSLTTDGSGYMSVALSSQAVSQGKWYWEVKIDVGAANGVNNWVGGVHSVLDNTGTLASNNSYCGKSTTSWGFTGVVGPALKYYNNAAATTIGTSSDVPKQGDIVMFALDMDNQKLWYGLNGTWISSGVPASGTAPTITFSAGMTISPVVMVNTNAGGDKNTANFGATAFAYTPPTGFKSLNTANLASTAVTTSGTFIGNANADGPVIWTNGNPATLTINGNAVTFGTHADKTAGGFKLRSSSASYNTSGSNTWTATAGKRFVYSATSINTAQGNP
jgi:hypothetical protein